MKPTLEQLESRLNPSALLDYANGVLSLTGHADNLVVSASAGKYSITDVPVKVAVTQGFPPVVVGYTYKLGEPIDITPAAAALGFTGNGTEAVTGGSLAATDAIFIQSDGAIVNLRSLQNPTTLSLDAASSTNVSSNAPVNTGDMSGIKAPLTVNGGSLTLSNFGSRSAAHVTVNSDTIIGMGAQPITYSPLIDKDNGNGFGREIDGLVSLRLIGSNTPGVSDQYVVDNPSTPLSITAGHAEVDVVGLVQQLSVNLRNGTLNGVQNVVLKTGTALGWSGSADNVDFFGVSVINGQPIS
jgi:hypothetical protein